MKLARYLVGITLICAACGDDDKGSDDKNVDGSVVTNPDGAVSNVDGGANRDSGTTNPTGMDSSVGNTGDAGTCDVGDDKTPGTCTEAEYKDYGQCVASSCDSHFKTCNGADYRNGKYGGLCGTWLTCVSACGCDADLACLTACGRPSTECQTCLSDDSCLDPCGAEPECANNLPPANPDAGIEPGANCTQLTTCCNSITAADDKASCLDVVDTAQMAAGLPGGAAAAEQICSSAYTQFKASQSCQ